MDLTQINLQDENYLKAYEEHIRKLPLDELYDILDIIRKDSSPERIQIVEARIQELEEGGSSHNSPNQAAVIDIRSGDPVLEENTDEVGELMDSYNPSVRWIPTLFGVTVFCVIVAKIVIG